MKRQARPFVVETKRSRKAPTSLWASTPLLREELAATGVTEAKADAVFADKAPKERPRPAEPPRRILPSLIVEAPPEPVVIEEPVVRRRTSRDDVELDDRPKRGRPRRVPETTPESDAATPSRAPIAAKRDPAEPALRKAVRSPAKKPSPAEAATAAAEAVPLVISVRTTAPAAERPAQRVRQPKVDVAAAALPPGQRWKRRLPQRLW